MQTLKSYATGAWAWLGAKLMQHWMLVFGGLLVLLAGLVLLSGKKSQEAKDVVQQAVTENVLTKKQVKQKDKIIAQKLDSIRTQTVIIKQIVHVRDSLKVVAKVHDARADSLIKPIAHESPTPDPTDTPERVEQLLTDYRPKAWALAAGRDSLR